MTDETQTLDLVIERVLPATPEEVFDAYTDAEKQKIWFSILDEEPGISNLVLGAATGQKGPGPLISALTGKFIGRLQVPMTIVPVATVA